MTGRRLAAIVGLSSTSSSSMTLSWSVLRSPTKGLLLRLLLLTSSELSLLLLALLLLPLLLTLTWSSPVLGLDLLILLGTRQLLPDEIPYPVISQYLVLQFVI